MDMDIHFTDNVSLITKDFKAFTLSPQKKAKNPKNQNLSNSSVYLYLYLYPHTHTLALFCVSTN